MKKGLLSVLGIVLLILLLTLFMTTLYILYLNWPGELQKFTFIETEKKDINYSTSQQFYENMRFPSRQISYNFKEECTDEKIISVQDAFKILEDLTLLEFKRVLNDAQITIFCSSISPEPKDEGYFVAGEGGPSKVLNTTLYGAILAGKVSLYRDETCDTPTIAIHEILHVLGFKHNNNPNSILYPTLNCNQEIDDYIIQDLNNLYSSEGKPDLKIKNVDAEKKGRYLSFNIEIMNRGLVDVQNTSLKVYSEGEFVKEIFLDNIGIGFTKNLHVTNIKISKFDEKISFIVDETNFISEIFEDNNKVELILKEN